MPAQSANKRSLDSAKTRTKILQAATKLFVKSGFEGASISEIAKEAKINQSLIYHYFASKEELWKSVKSNFVEKFTEEKDLIFDAKKGLKKILHQIVHTRFDFYNKHPEIIRMIGWQKLEAKKDKLSGGTFFSPENWHRVFSELQKQGEIRHEINVEMMILFITSVITGAFTESDLNKWKGETNKKHEYLDMIIDSFMLSFGKSSGSKHRSKG